jgi:hypothetical protein
MQVCVQIPEPKLDKTEELLEQILVPIIKDDARVRFLCPAGSGGAIVQRLRVMISRKRKDLERKNQRTRRFKLHSSIHSETHNGERFDCAVLWQSITELHHMTQDLEDVLLAPERTGTNG